MIFPSLARHECHPLPPAGDDGLLAPGAPRRAVSAGEDSLTHSYTSAETLDSLHVAISAGDGLVLVARHEKLAALQHVAALAADEAGGMVRPVQRREHLN